MSLRNLRKLLALSALLILTLAAALGAACTDGSGLADQDRDDSDEIGLPDDDNGIEPARVNPNAPAAPTNLTAQVMSYNRIDLAWNDNSGNEAGFKVYRKLGRKSWVLVGALAPGVETCQAISLKPGKTYRFKIIAYNSYGKTISNIVSTITPLMLPIAAPTGLTATPFSSTQINLTWTDASNNEDGFKIERKTGAGGAWAEIDTAGMSATTYQSAGLSPSTTYYFRVRAYNTAAVSAYSNEAIATTQAPPVTIPNPPSVLTAAAISSSQINLAWTDNSNNEITFKIERKTGIAGTWGEIDTVSADVVSYQNTGLAASTAYYYRVRAYNSAGNSAYSNEADATTQAPPPTIPNPPSGLTATVTSSSQINLSWTDNSSDETGFKIERKTGVAGTWVEITTVGTGVVVFQNTTLSAETTYYYRVRAYNGAGDSTYSNEPNATTYPLNMSLIPAGCFNMGDAFSEGYSDEIPVHNVCLPYFYMDVHEVTNAEYAACVSGGGCTAPGNSSSDTRVSYYGNSTYNNFPVIYVSWNQATAYCAWAGKRLPTEAEWEYAARGGLSGKRYPNGDDISCAGANHYDNVAGAYCVGDTSSVGSYPANGYGLYDMSGNVWERVNDWYLATYYTGRPSPDNDPTGPNTTGTWRVVRGGGWLGYTANLRVASRNYYASLLPEDQTDDVGFRCARD